MIKEVIDCISNKIQEAFGDGYLVCSEDITEELIVPRFVVKLKSAAALSMLGTRIKRENLFEISYYPASVCEPNAEIYTVSEKLINELEFIVMPNGDRILGRKQNMKVEENILHFLVNYDFITNVQKSEDTFGGIEVYANTKTQ